MAVTQMDDGQLVLVKRARPGAAAERLRREATALALAAGDGCVELVEVADEADGGVRLVTAWVGGGSLATVRLERPRLLGVARALATSLAALHARDLVHGRLAPDHVLLDGDRPVLCGFGGCRLPGEGTGPSAHDDVEALLALLAGAVADHGGAVADRLRAVIAAGIGGGAAAVADRLADPAPARPVPPREPRARGGRQRRRFRAPTERRPPVRALLATGVAALVLLTLAVGVWQDGGPSSPMAPRAATTAPVCPSPPPPAADLDGDGCPEAVQVRGAVVTAGDRRWAVGDEGDVVSVGDWECDGRATAAVLRPPTGEVWVYDSWATADRTVEARPGPRALGASGARTVAGSEGCDRLEVTTADGGRRVLELA